MSVSELGFQPIQLCDFFSTRPTPLQTPTAETRTVVTPGLHAWTLPGWAGLPGACSLPAVLPVPQGDAGLKEMSLPGALGGQG